MESSRRRDSPSLSALADLTVAQRSENELNRLESDMISDSFAEDSKIGLHLVGNPAKTAWTNEKHDLYLDHLESTFVKQLHRSILKNHPKRAGKQCFVRAAKVQDSTTALNVCARDNNSFSNEAGKSLDYFEEFSDQNFPDEASELMCVTTRSKRSKTIVS